MCVYEWDQEKAEKNEKKHGISFADTFAVFEDARALTIEQKNEEEERYVTVGIDVFGRILVVAYTWRGTNIRIISARKATPSEVKHYESQL